MTGVRAAGLSAGYEGRPVLTDVSFDARAGQVVGVLGPNGGGKTTLFRVLLGELPHTGEVAVDGSVGSVPQGDRARLDFPESALDVALMGAYARTPWYRRIARTDRDLARDALARVGLEDRAGVPFGTLSGGQRRRVLIARALVKDPQVLLLDEPFAGVDAASEERILTLFDELAAEGRTLLVATHDVAQARRWHRVLCLHGCQVAFGTPDEVLTAPTLERTYGDDLVAIGGDLAVQSHHHDHDHG